LGKYLLQQLEQAIRARVSSNLDRNRQWIEAASCMKVAAIKQQQVETARCDRVYVKFLPPHFD